LSQKNSTLTYSYNPDYSIAYYAFSMLVQLQPTLGEQKQTTGKANTIRLIRAVFIRCSKAGTQNCSFALSRCQLKRLRRAKNQETKRAVATSGLCKRRSSGASKTHCKICDTL